VIRTLQDLHAAVHQAGAHATQIARLHVFGTRRTPVTNAGTSPPTMTAIGVAPSSVWNGPRQVSGGAPVLKRDRQA
jgi:hypothetical protein